MKYRLSASAQAAIVEGLDPPSGWESFYAPEPGLLLPVVLPAERLDEEWKPQYSETLPILYDRWGALFVASGTAWLSLSTYAIIELRWPGALRAIRQGTEQTVQGASIQEVRNVCMDYTKTETKPPEIDLDLDGII